jgi:hypothetical protein
MSGARSALVSLPHPGLAAIPRLPINRRLAALSLIVHCDSASCSGSRYRVCLEARELLGANRILVVGRVPPLRVGGMGSAGCRLACEPIDVVFRSLADIERVIRASWSAQTCDPVDLAEWSTESPARGQCAVTALVVQDLLGGELLLAEVRNAEGSRQGLHYWNRLPGGVEVDVTREQFTATEIVQAPRAVPRPPDTTRGRLTAQYQALATAVRAGLMRSTSA